MATWEAVAVVAGSAGGNDWDDEGAPDPVYQDDPASAEILPRAPAAVSDGGRRMNPRFVQTVD